jgi:hypothetical protein
VRDLPPIAGRDGNIESDPGFLEDGSYLPGAGSPLVDAGDPSIHDTDGSRSDIGIGGGPSAMRLPERDASEESE